MSKIDESQDILSKKITRRELLKYVGVGAVGLGLASVVGKFGVAQELAKNSESGLIPNASADNLGSWSLGVNLLSCPIHAALLPSGKVLYLSGSNDDLSKAGGPYLAGTWDPATDVVTQLTVPEDVFCCGNTMLPSGNVLLGGGNLMYDAPSPNGRFWGLSSAFEYDFTTDTFVKVSSMSHGRWYPTEIVLPSGKVIVVSGLDEFGCMNYLTEIYDPSTKSFTISYDPLSNRTYAPGYCTTLPGAGSPIYGGTKQGVSPPLSLYPRMHVMPNGLVAMVGQSKALGTWNPNTGHWVATGVNALGKNRQYGSSVMLPLQNTITETGKILLIGGSDNASVSATNTCEIVTPKTGALLQSQLTASMQYQRKFLNATMMPNGTILVNGGTTQLDYTSNAVLPAEMFDPTNNTWTTLPTATVIRMYHQVALLLPDGRVWTAGTTYKGTPGELRTEIFSPPYVSSTRPTISGTPKITFGYGSKIKIPTPDAENISAVSLMRVASVTHSFSADQRLIWLPIVSKTSTSVLVSAPINARIAPSGYYMIHVLDNNSVPSMGKFIKIPS
jgi:hypothetical protein